MPRLGNIETLILCVSCFAVVLEAAPPLYSEEYARLYDPGNHRYHDPLQFGPGNIFPRETRALIQEPQIYAYADHHAEHFDRKNRAFDGHVHGYQRRPRSEEISSSNYLTLKPNIVKSEETRRGDEDIYFAFPQRTYRNDATKLRHQPTRFYVDRSAAAPAVYHDENDHDEDGGDDYQDKSSVSHESGHLGIFPISMMRQESIEMKPRRGLTDKELGEIVRKAITAAKYEETEDIPIVRRFPPSGLSNPLYRPRIRQNYSNKSAPEMNIDVIRPEVVDRTPQQDTDRLSSDSAANKSFKLEDDVTATIGEQSQSAEVQPDNVADESRSAAEPETNYEYLGEIVTIAEENGENNGKEDTNDDALEGDVVLSVISEDDEQRDEIIDNEERHEEHENEGAGETSSIDNEDQTELPPPTTVNPEILELERELSFLDEINEQPPTPTPASFTEETITDTSTTPRE